MPRVHLIIACWGGDRRVKEQAYVDDRGYYIKKQLRFLCGGIKHGLSTITFANNIDPDENASFRDSWNYIPDRFGDTNIVKYEKANFGMSYGLFSCVFGNDLKNVLHDYYIFIEDDYVFILDNFDEIMVSLLESDIRCGYMCMFASGYPAHPAVFNGIIRGNDAHAVWNNNGMLPHNNDTVNACNYGVHEFNGQVAWGFAIQSIGKYVGDVRGKYNSVFQSHTGELRYLFGDDCTHPILCTPSIMVG